jgi:hypothetical protein
MGSLKTMAVSTTFFCIFQDVVSILISADFLQMRALVEEIIVSDRVKHAHGTVKG